MSKPVAFLSRRDGSLAAFPPVTMPCENCDLAEACSPGVICPHYIPDTETDADGQIEAWRQR